MQKEKARLGRFPNENDIHFNVYNGWLRDIFCSDIGRFLNKRGSLCPRNFSGF